MILIITSIQNMIETMWKFIHSLNFIILIFLIITIYHILLYLFRDRNYITNLKRFNDVPVDSISQLKEILLVSIIVPAWKEGENFKQCLNSISQLKYQKLKVIINVGGSKETIEIANSFKDNQKFTVLYQKAGEGKIKAINDCLKTISYGIICVIDADILLNDDILLNMIYPIVNGDEDIVIAPLIPHFSIINNDLVKYLYINRNAKFKQKFTRYTFGFASNACIKHDIIKAIGKFSEKRLLDDAITTGIDLKSKGFKSFRLINHNIPSLTYPITIKDYLNQNLRWIENFLYFSMQNQKFKIIKFVGLAFLSIFFLALPLFFFINISLFLIGVIFFYYLYLKRIRKIIFYKITNKEKVIKIKFFFFIKLIFYIFLDILTNVIAFFEILFYRKAYKKRKNIFFSEDL